MDIVGPVKLEIETLKSWKFAMSQAATTLKSWDLLGHRLHVAKNESEKVEKNVVAAKKAESLAIEIDLSTDEIIKDKFDREYIGAIAYHLKLSIHVDGYKPKDIYFIAFLYGGWASITLDNGPSKNQLSVQLNDIEQIISSVENGTDICVPVLHSLKKYKEDLSKIVSS